MPGLSRRLPGAARRGAKNVTSRHGCVVRVTGARDAQAREVNEEDVDPNEPAIPLGKGPLGHIQDGSKWVFLQGLAS